MIKNKSLITKLLLVALVGSTFQTQAFFLTRFVRGIFSKNVVEPVVKGSFFAALLIGGACLCDRLVFKGAGVRFIERKLRETFRRNPVKKDGQNRKDFQSSGDNNPGPNTKDPKNPGTRKIGPGRPTKPKPKSRRERMKKCSQCDQDKNERAFNRLSCCGQECCNRCLMGIIDGSIEKRSTQGLVCPHCQEQLNGRDLGAITYHDRVRINHINEIKSEEYIKETQEIENPQPEPTKSKPNLTDSTDRLVIYEKEKECPICYEDINCSYKLSCCGYEACGACTMAAIDKVVTDKDSNYLLCPNKECKDKKGRRTVISNKDLRAISTMVSGDLVRIKQIQDIKLKEHILKYKDKKGFRACPTPNCPYFFINKDNQEQTEYCPSCHQQYCGNCLNPHSERISCREYKENGKLVGNKNEVERLNEEWKKRNTKVCPSCKADVNRDGGCNHMTCRCGHQFCYRCNYQCPANNPYAHGSFDCDLF